ncbi:diacylglycerol O-acyltransferase 2-like [Heterodontus francisci]|uniref:diacylglycerol O-acyltransferase 2-like n=1 Tax=Heterodontus francisci TaxID=7792 RepID=UPI00355B58F5
MARSLMETLSVLQWIVVFFTMGISCTFLTGYLLFTPLWPLSVLYLTWLIIDWNTPERGGRRSQWVRRWRMWRYMRDYFPVSLVKTAELSPERNYVLGHHPHGIMCFGAICNFCTESTDFSKLFPGITPFVATLHGIFRLPIYRDYVLSAGLCSVSKSSLSYLLSKKGTGNAVIIVVGGAAESMTGKPGEHSLLLKNRKGFIRLAVAHGADLVPIYSFGENDAFDQVIFEPGSWMKWLQLNFQKYMGFAPCLFKGCGLLFSNTWGLMPFARPVMTVVGEPIPVTQNPNPSEDEINRYHNKYQEAITILFNKYKVQYGLSESAELTIY